MNQIKMTLYVLDLKFDYKSNGGIYFDGCQGNRQKWLVEGKRKCFYMYTINSVNNE